MNMALTRSTIEFDTTKDETPYGVVIYPDGKEEFYDTQGRIFTNTKAIEGLQVRLKSKESL